MSENTLTEQDRADLEAGRALRRAAEGEAPATGEGPRLVSDREAQTLMLMLGYGQQDDGFTEADFAAVMEWAEQTRMNEGLLMAVLDASMSVCVQDGEVMFKTTAKGDREAQAIISQAG